MTAKLNSSKASAKLVTVTALYLSKAQYSRRMLTFLQEFTAISALIPNMFQDWLFYQNLCRLSGLTGVRISLKETGSSKKCMILSLVWAESQYSFALNSSYSIYKNVYQFDLLLAYFILQQLQYVLNTHVLRCNPYLSSGSSHPYGSKNKHTHNLIIPEMIMYSASSQLGLGSASAHVANMWYGSDAFKINTNSEPPAVMNFNSRITLEAVKSGVNLERHKAHQNFSYEQHKGLRQFL